MSGELVPAVEPEYVAHCEASRDVLVVRSSKDPRTGEGVLALISATPSGGIQSIVIHPEAARKLAAAILNHADKLEGVVPLRFFPPDAATGVYPDGHPDKED